MKIITQLFFTFLFISIFTFSNCKKNKTNNPVDELPPETQTGTNTFGCLVNGQIFKPGGAQLSGGSLNAIYQNLMPSVPNGFTFGVSAKNQNINCFYKTVSFGFDSVIMNQGIYSLKKRKSGSGGGAYQEFPCNQSFIEFLTTEIVVGELNIKKFDTISQIASGTFWFDAIDLGGKKIEIRQGRFDVRYTK